MENRIKIEIELEIQNVCKMWLKNVYADLDMESNLMTKDIMQVINKYTTKK